MEKLRKTAGDILHISAQLLGGAASHTLDFLGHVAGHIAHGAKNTKHFVSHALNPKEEPFKWLEKSDAHPIPWYYRMAIRTLNSLNEIVRVIREDDDKDDHRHENNLAGNMKRLALASKWPLQVACLGMIGFWVTFIALPGSIPMIGTAYAASPVLTVLFGLASAGTVGAAGLYVAHKSGGLWQNLSHAAKKLSPFKSSKETAPEDTADAKEKHLWDDIRHGFNRRVIREVDIKDYGDFMPPDPETMAASALAETFEESTAQPERLSLISERAKNFYMWAYAKHSLQQTWRDATKVITTPMPAAAKKGDHPLEDDRQSQDDKHNTPSGPA